MDGFAIISGALTVAQTTFTVSNALYNFIRSSKIVDQTLEELYSEVVGLSKALDSISLSLEEPAIARIKSDGSGKGAWGSLDVAITDTQHTVNALAGIVGGLGTVKSSAGPFRKAAKQVKLNLHSDQISDVRDRIRTHTNSVQLALQTSIFSIISQSSDNMIHSVNPKLDTIIKTIDTLREAMESRLNPSRLTIRDNLPIKLQNPDLVDHTKQLIGSASAIVTSRSTACGGSEVRYSQASENGQPLDKVRKSSIETWISQVASLEEDTPPTSHTPVSKDEIHIEEIALDSDSDDDFDLAMKHFEKGQEKFGSDRHKDALLSFGAGLKRVDGLSLRKKRRLELREVQLKMGLSLLFLGELGESEQRLLSVASAQTKDDKGVRLVLHASSGLAQVFLCKRSFAEADEWCRKSRNGWKRVGVRGHPAYTACLRLSAFACELKGDHPEAVLFEELANESKATPAAADTKLETPESPGFTIEEARTLVTEYHKKVPDTTGEKASTKSRRCSPAKQPGNGPVNGPQAPTVAESSNKPRSGSTPLRNLHHAAREGDNALIENLLENGADIEKAAGNVGYARPLHLAAINGHRSAVECLLDHGADIEAKDEHGHTALRWAVWQGHVFAVECLLDRGADIEAPSQHGYRALLDAANGCYTSMIECLLDHGADIEARDHSGRTALLSACSRGLSKSKIQNIELLCSRGADVSVEDDEGKSPLTCASKVKKSRIRKELVRVLKKYGAKE